MTIRKQKLLASLREAHWLLQHYADLLNIHDGGKRKIPKNFHRFIKKFGDHWEKKTELEKDA